VHIVGWRFSLRVLTVDIGTGTQDILLFDSDLELENCPHIVAPSPTQVVARRVRAATRSGRPLRLSGVTMGGGPCSWAIEDHLRAGLPVHATPDAARTLDDDLDRVTALGVTLIDDADVVADAISVSMHDLDLDSITAALNALGAGDGFDVLAVAVFDHGAAPPGVSDRAFRFAYIAEIVRQDDLTAFAYRAADVPDRLTRMKAVARCAPHGLPTVIMDTGPAAAIGALEDTQLAKAASALVVNVGNFHTLAFHLEGHSIVGLFEHHTGELTQAQLEVYVEQLAAGTIDNAAVFADMGHGSLVTGRSAGVPDLVGVIGPRRSLLHGSRLRPYFAVPHGDMMLAGCYGLLRAVASRLPWTAEAIKARLLRTD
jgi:uncharacterized protein (DUF1786 family)